MLDIFLKIYNTIFPPRESVRILHNQTTEDFVGYFSPHKFTNCIALSSYSTPAIKAAITENKFHDNKQASALLSVLLEHWLTTVPEVPTIFIPIPLSLPRLKSRGYNQVTRVLESTKNNKLEIENLLIRRKDTRSQTSLDREQRFKNINEAFSFNAIKTNLSGYRIVIVDDVITTGATMFEAHSTLSIHLPNDSEIICLALTH